MKKLIKSLFYQMKVEYLWKKVFFILLLFLIVLVWMDVFLDTSLGTVTKALVEGDTTSGIPMFVMMFMIMVGAETYGNDFADRTINQELLSGHSRAEVYFSRAVISLVFGVLGSLLLLVLPFGIFSAMGYYGDTLELKGLLLRILLSGFIIARLGCEIIFLSCIVKNVYVTMAAGVMVVLIGSAVSGAFSHQNFYMMCNTNFREMFRFGGWFTYRVTDLKTVSVYRSMPGKELVVGTIAASVCFSVLFLFLGYMIFWKDDLR